MTYEHVYYPWDLSKRSSTWAEEEPNSCPGFAIQSLWLPVHRVQEDRVGLD